MDMNMKYGLSPRATYCEFVGSPQFPRTQHPIQITTVANNLPPPHTHTSFFQPETVPEGGIMWPTAQRPVFLCLVPPHKVDVRINWGRTRYLTLSILEKKIVGRNQEESSLVWYGTPVSKEQEGLLKVGHSEVPLKHSNCQLSAI